jgi:hypothetical protein
VFGKKLCRIFFNCLLLMIFLVNASIAFAAEAGAEAGTPGVSGQKPLAYLGTVLVDGGKIDNATDVPLNPKLKIEFDKNVVNSLFWANNSQCFSMKSSNNEAIPLNVTKVDDTVDFSQRQLIFVQPVSPLQPGTSYQLIISPNLQAKNGVAVLGGTTNGQGVTVAFKTIGEAVQQVPQATVTPTPQPATSVVKPTPNMENSTNGEKTSSDTLNPSSNDDTTKQTDSSDVQNTTLDLATISPDSSTPAPVSQSPNETKKGGGISGKTWLTIIGAVLLVAWITAEIIARKKRK